MLHNYIAKIKFCQGTVEIRITYYIHKGFLHVINAYSEHKEF